MVITSISVSYMFVDSPQQGEVDNRLERVLSLLAEYAIKPQTSNTFNEHAEKKRMASNGN
jgi:hypothetical protein